MKMTISVGRCLKRKTMLVWVKEYINKNLATCRILARILQKSCNLQKLYTAFKEKHANVNIGLSNICVLRLKWCVLASPKITHCVCVCRTHQNVMLLVMQWTGTWHTKTWLRRLFTTLRATNASCIGVNPVLALQLWKNFSIRSSTNMKMIRNLITVSGTLRIEQYWQPLQPLTKSTKRLWLMLLMI